MSRSISSNAGCSKSLDRTSARAAARVRGTSAAPVEAGISAATRRRVASARIARVPAAQRLVAPLPVAMVGHASGSRFMEPTLALQAQRRRRDLLKDRSGSRTLGRKAPRRDITMCLARILGMAAASQSGSVHPSCSSARRVMRRLGALVAAVERAAHRVPAGAVEAVTPVVAADTEVTAKVRLQKVLPSARSRPSRRIRAFFFDGEAAGSMIKLIRRKLSEIVYIITVIGSCYDYDHG